MAISEKVMSLSLPETNSKIHSVQNLNTNEEIL